MFLVFLGLFVLAVPLLVAARRRFDRSGPPWRVRVIAILINLGTMGAVLLATVLVTGHASVVMIPVGLIVAALGDLALTEVIRRRRTIAR